MGSRCAKRFKTGKGPTGLRPTEPKIANIILISKLLCRFDVILLHYILSCNKDLLVQAYVLFGGGGGVRPQADTGRLTAKACHLVYYKNKI